MLKYGLLFKSYKYILNYVKGKAKPSQTAVVGTMPNGNRKYALVGGSPWDDAKTIEGAISIVIHAMAQAAHNIY